MSAEYNPKSNVIFGDVDLSDYNAFAIYCNIFDRPERDVEVVSVPGRNGDLIFDNGRYKNLDRVYTIQVTGVQNTHNLVAALTNIVGYQRLEDEYDATVYMLARIKGKPRIAQFVGNAVLMTVTFDRVPQRYLKSGWNYEECDSSGYKTVSGATNVWNKNRFTWYRKYLKNETNGAIYPFIKFGCPKIVAINWDDKDNLLQISIYVTPDSCETNGTYTRPSDDYLFMQINNVKNDKWYNYSDKLYNEIYYIDSEKRNVYSKGNPFSSDGRYDYNTESTINRMGDVEVYGGFPELSEGDNYVHFIVQDMPTDDGYEHYEHGTFESAKWEYRYYEKPNGSYVFYHSPIIAPRGWIL